VNEVVEDFPLVTVAMPVYNAGKYLRLAVLSIVKQTFISWELLIVDDGSTDDALKSIADIDDSRIRILRDGKNKGLAARLNECIDMARGQYLARMDQDDVSYPERFAHQIEALQKKLSLDLVATRVITMDENERLTGVFPYAITHKEICARPWMGFYFVHPTWMGKTAWFRKHRYTSPGPYFCEDQDLLLRSYSNSSFATLDEILFAYRIKSAVNWPKLAKTRRTVLLRQLRQFYRINRWHFVLLSVAVFVARMGIDLLKKLSRRVSHPEHADLDNTIVLKWNLVLKDLAPEAKAL
jgi:glycosyltransferase involved in cell wall biosynthesis